MPLPSVSPAYAAAELRAHEHRAKHEFSEAAQSAESAAEIARGRGDSATWWDMTFFQAENLLEAGSFEACANLAWELVQSLSEGSARGLQARARVLLAKALQAAGHLEEAADSARTAAELMADDPDVETYVLARQALIAALADSGALDAAWTESLILAEVASAEVDEQLLGKSYWVVGNVAFLCGKVHEGLFFHELAAATFSPTRNLDVWAKFNKASAAMRLAADIGDAATLRCIERAELATDVIGGSANDYGLLKLNRAHWNLLAGDPLAAIAVLEDLCGPDDSLTPQRIGEAFLLLGRAHAAVRNTAAARVHLLEAAAHFETAGAQQRADHARGILTALG
jgi:hypothetical protein